jgi:hypothetical protein
MSLIKVMEELINKAQGYTTKHTGSGTVAEAVNHDAAKAPSEDEAKKEKNAANSGTHPKSGGTPGSSNNPEGGEDFKSGGAAEDTIETPKGTGGRAPVARPGTIKHEGGGAGPNNPGTATSAEKSEGDADLEKGENPFPPKKDDDDNGEKDDKGEKKDDDKDEKKEDAEKSVESGEVFLDIDEFVAQITKSVSEDVFERVAAQFGEAIEKSQDSEYIEAGLAKSLTATLDRVEELEKAITNIAKAMNIRKSLLKSADNIKGIDNPSLSKTTLSKSEISSRLLDMQMSGQHGVDTNMVLKFDAVGDISMLPSVVKSKLGIEE